MSRPISRHIFTRRQFLKLSGASALLLGGGYATARACKDGFNTTDILQITEHTIARSDLPKVFDGFSLAFLSDIHYSPAIPREWIRRLVDLVNERGVDLVLLGGDYLWIPDSPISSLTMNYRNKALANLQKSALLNTIFSHLEEEFGLFRSTLGVYGVYGNHDRWIDPAPWGELFKRAGATLLLNDLVTLPHPRGGKVELFGADDYWTGNPTSPNFSSSKNTLKIMVSHNPDHVVEKCRADLPPDCLALSGHTHGGQIRLPFFGPLIHNIRATDYTYGLNRVGDAMLFTSRGVGVVELPYRINCPQELVFITFKKRTAKNLT